MENEFKKVDIASGMCKVYQMDGIALSEGIAFIHNKGYELDKKKTLEKGFAIYVKQDGSVTFYGLATVNREKLCVFVAVEIKESDIDKVKNLIFG